MKFSAPHWGWTSGRATPSLRPTPMRQRQQTRQDATYRSRKSVQTNGASSLSQAGLSMADVDLQSLSEKSGEFDRLDERDERLAGRRDEILRQIERRRSGWAKLVRRTSEVIVEGEFHELPSDAQDGTGG